MPAQNDEGAARLVFAQKAPRPAADDDGGAVAQICLHVDAAAIADVAFDEDLPAAHRIARGVARAAVHFDDAAVHRVARRLLHVALDGQLRAVEVRSEGVPRRAVNDDLLVFQPRAEVPLPDAGEDLDIFFALAHRRIERRIVHPVCVDLHLTPPVQSFLPALRGRTRSTRGKFSAPQSRLLRAGCAL